MPERSSVLSTGAAVVRDACAKEKAHRKRDGKGHQRSGGNAEAAVNLQRIGAIACQGSLERVGKKGSICVPQRGCKSVPWLPQTVCPCGAETAPPGNRRPCNSHFALTGRRDQPPYRDGSNCFGSENLTREVVAARDRKSVV